MSVKLRSRQYVSRLARLILGEEFYFSLHRRLLQLRSNRRVFTAIYEGRLWGAAETVSGDGSTLESSASFRDALPGLLAELGAASLLDAGCGDFNWMKTVNLNGIQYIGVDVVEPLVTRNIELYASESRTFLIGDITSDPLRKADVALCRHCLIHLSNRQVCMALRNLKNIGVKYLLATTFPVIVNNADIWPGSFRPINLEIPPFNLPKPLRTFHDSRDQSSMLALWRFADISI
jgi:2-polyprenyl-3-methyl-5-hydroxy-6-metoxy-1,4-benzoquinol methylase